MKKTHIPDSPITGHQYHNHQVTSHFCAKCSDVRSAGLGTGRSAGRNAGLSVRSRNMVRFFSVTPEKCELALGNHKT
jgi:hypothetical protein